MNAWKQRFRQCAATVGVIVLIIGLSACNTTQVAPYQHRASSDTNNSPYARVVEVDIDPQYFVERPDCVLLLPIASSAGPEPLFDLLEQYLALHLRFRFDSVIQTTERVRRMTRVNIEPGYPDHWPKIGESPACGYEIAFRLIHARADFALVWAQLSLGIEARLTRISDGHVLWIARHTATRSDGGIAISPFGVVSSAVEATALVSDGDQLVSLAADVTRRVVATLPPQDQGYKAYCRGKPPSFARLCGVRSAELLEGSRSTDKYHLPNQRRALQNKSIVHR